MLCARCGTAGGADLDETCPRCLVEFALGKIDEPLPAAVGPYRVVERLGRGGMGVVYRVEQPELGRHVALKILPSVHRADDIDRFRREARAAGRLRHPGVVAVHDFGTYEGAPYFTMDLVEGGSLADRLDAGPMTPADAARLIAAVGRAVHHAHEQGIIHRDLKPSNILIDGAGGPHVTDFGVARDLSVDATATRTGFVLGTAGYMAPEQIRGERDSIGPASDVYALGITLLECVTGQHPFRAATPEAMVERMLRDDPPIPPTVPRDLAAVIQRAAEKNPLSRYPTADALAEDLERFARGEPVRARRRGPVKRAARWVARRPWLVAVAAVAAAIGVQFIPPAPPPAPTVVRDTAAYEEAREAWEQALQLVTPETREARWAALVQAHDRARAAFYGDSGWHEARELYVDILLRMGRGDRSWSIESREDAIFSNPAAWLEFMLVDEFPVHVNADALEVSIAGASYDHRLYLLHATSLPQRELLARDVARALDFGPTYWEVHALAAAIDLRDGKYDSVLARADEIESLLPGHPLAPIVRALVYRTPARFDAVASTAHLDEARRRGGRDIVTLLGEAVLGWVVLHPDPAERWVLLPDTLSLRSSYRNQWSDPRHRDSAELRLPRLLRAQHDWIVGDLRSASLALSRGAAPVCMEGYALELGETISRGTSVLQLHARAQREMEPFRGRLGERPEAEPLFREVLSRTNEVEDPLVRQLLPAVARYGLAGALALQGRAADSCAELDLFLAAGYRVEDVEAAPWFDRIRGASEWAALASRYRPGDE